MSLVILNFHGVGPVPRDIDHGERNCWLDLDFFEVVLDLVRDQRQVRLTVDDGNASDLEFILPALLRRDLKAQFFVCAGRLNQPTFLDRSQLRELLAQGMAIGSHGMAHRAWRHLSLAELKVEIEGSRIALEAACGVTVDTAACPFGAYDRTVLRGLRRAGYRTVYTSDGGVASDNDWLCARTTVTRSMPLGDIQHLIRHGPGGWQQASINARGFFKRLRS